MSSNIRKNRLEKNLVKGGRSFIMTLSRVVLILALCGLGGAALIGPFVGGYMLIGDFSIIKLAELVIGWVYCVAYFIVFFNMLWIKGSFFTTPFISENVGKLNTMGISLLVVSIIDLFNKGNTGMSRISVDNINLTLQTYRY
ncbi:MAG: hypothetical protein LBN09_05040 [Clostridioides sp.]|jgi:hypothetical protein|nr:hypothetical protein [Clostridioides sp.]